MEISTKYLAINTPRGMAVSHFSGALLLLCLVEVGAVTSGSLGRAR